MILYNDANVRNGLFFYIFVPSTVNMFIVNFNGDWIQTADLW